MMDFEGITPRFRLNRPLSDREVKEQLRQKERKDVVPNPYNAVIRMNSTTLEVCDKCFFERGMLSFVGLCFPLIFIVGFCAVLIDHLTTMNIPSYAHFKFEMNVALVIIGTLALTVSFFFFKYFLLRESFSYTHYPIIFNRKTRKVHAFRYDGKIITEFWENLFITMGEPGRFETYDIQCHVLAPDRKTIVDTFSLPYYDYKNAKDFYAFWEFVRRYMEDEKELPDLVSRVTTCLPIHDKKPGFFGALKIMIRDDIRSMGSVGAFFSYLLRPTLYALPRWIADVTSRIPKWPAEIEAECQPEPDDPYVVNEESMKKARERLSALPAQ